MNFWGTALDRRQAEECFEELAFTSNKLELAFSFIRDVLSDYINIEVNPDLKSKHLEILSYMEKEYNV